MGTLLDLDIISSNLAPGESYRGNCPYCHRANTFSVRRAYEVPHKVTFRCYSMNCGSVGVLGSTGYVRDTLKVKPKGRPFTEDTSSLTVDCREYLVDKYPLLHREHIDRQRWKQTIQGNRLVMPILTDVGKEIGQQVKDFNGTAFSKVQTYWDDEAPKIHYPVHEYAPIDNHTMFVVEDVISSVVISQFARCVSILGTSFCEDRINFLQKTGRKIKLALDPDTWQGAYVFGQLRRLTGILPISAMMLSADPKNYTNRDELQRDLGL